MKRPYPSIRIFKSDFLERFTHIHPALPLLFWTPIIAFVVGRGYYVHELSIVTLFYLFVGAIVFWSIAEYFLHRVIFHFNPIGPISDRLLFLLHGIHHDDPEDPTRLVMPPLVGVLIGIPFYVLFLSVLGPEMADPFFGFFLMGYLWYDYSHYAIHHFKPRTAWGRMIKQNHMLHHYADPSQRFGVSTPFWDYVMRTQGRKSESIGRNRPQPAVDHSTRVPGTSKHSEQSPPGP